MSSMRKVSSTAGNNPRSVAHSKPRTAKSGPKREEVQLRAYQIYLERGGAPGNEFEDWMQAERELIQRNGKTRRTAKAKAQAA
jgi:hypothetical protein